MTSLSELVHHHSRVADGLMCSLLYPAPKRDRPPALFSLSPTQADEWEVDRQEIMMRTKLGAKKILRGFLPWENRLLLY